MKKVIVYAASLAALALGGCSDGKDGDLAGNPAALVGAWHLTWENDSETDLTTGKTESGSDDCSGDNCYLLFAADGTSSWSSDYDGHFGPYDYAYDPRSRQLVFSGYGAFSDEPCRVETLTASRLVLVWEGTDTWTEMGTEYSVRYREESVFEKVENPREPQLTGN